MVQVSSNGSMDSEYWAKEVKAFDETKAGVKGLVDAGLAKIPPIFVHPKETLENHQSQRGAAAPSDLPTIDFHGVEAGGERRREVVEGIRKAAHEWGFFRIVNHGVPSETIDAMLGAIKRFHELPTEDKKQYYSNDNQKRVALHTYPPTGEGQQPYCWRDLLRCIFTNGQLDPNDIPLACRNELVEYMKCVVQLGETMAELLSEALGLSSDYLSHIESMKSETVACLYYPICPEPENTLGNRRHTDMTSLTLLIQDSIGGLQIRHDDQWVDVPPYPGAIIANIGDLMQMISNDKFISVEHRVLAQPAGPRISVACFFVPSTRALAKPFAPIKELLSDENPAVYREFLYMDYMKVYREKGQGGSALPYFRIQ